MVLYYKKVSPKESNSADSKHNVHSARAGDSSPNPPNYGMDVTVPPVSTITRTPLGSRANNGKLVKLENAKDYTANYANKFDDDIEKTPIALASRKELYMSLLEDNFNNMSTDDKFIIMYKSITLRQNTMNSYISVCIALLLIIVLKLFSK